MSDLRTRIAKVLHQRQATADAPEGWVWTWEQESEYEQRSWLEDADAVIKEIAAFRLEVSEDEFLDAVIAEDDGTCCAALVSDNE
jgi:hypothetical protein